MFKWLTEYAKDRFCLRASFWLDNFSFKFAFYNFNLEFDIPLPFKAWEHTIKCFQQEFPSIFTRKYKGIHSCKNRTMEVYTSFNTAIAFCFDITIPAKNVNDHDMRCLDIRIPFFNLSVNTWHDYRLCHPKKDSWKERFPTDEEIAQYDEFCAQNKLKIFGDTKPEHFDFNNKKNPINKKWKKYWKLNEEFYDSIPNNDPE